MKDLDRVTTRKFYGIFAQLWFCHISINYLGRKNYTFSNEIETKTISLNCFYIYNHRRWLAAGTFGFKKKRKCTLRVAKTKALVTAKLICVFVFAYADCWFSCEADHILLLLIY